MGTDLSSQDMLLYVGIRGRIGSFLLFLPNLLIEAIQVNL